MKSSRALLASFVILSMLSTLAACGNRKPLKDAKKQVTEQVAAGIDGQYRTESQIRSDDEDYVSSKFSMLEIKENKLVSKNLNEANLEMQSDEIGTLRPAGGLSFEIDAASNLDELVQNRSDLVPFAAMFEGGARVRLLLNGDQLSLVTIRGNDQSTPVIYRKLKTEDAQAQQTKVMESAKRLRDFKANFVRDWGNKKLGIFKRETITKVNGVDRSEVVEGSKIEEESSAGASGKKNISFKFIEFLSATEGRTNGKHKANVRLLMLRRDSKLLIDYVSAADQALYTASSMLVEITKAENGELVLQENSRDRRVIRTYRLAETLPAPSAEGGSVPADGTGTDQSPETVVPESTAPAADAPPQGGQDGEKEQPVIPVTPPEGQQPAPATETAERPATTAPAERPVAETDPATGLPMVIPGFGPIEPTK